MFHNLGLALEIFWGVFATLWIVAFAIAGIRRLIHGPFIPEPINAAFIAKYEARAAVEGWVHRILVVFDIGCNVFFMRGQQDETMSAHGYRAAVEGKQWGKVFEYWLSLMQPQHGPKALIGDSYRAKNRLATNQKILGI